MLSRAWASGWSSFDSLRRDMDERSSASLAMPPRGSTSSIAMTNGIANGQAETFLRDRQVDHAAGFARRRTEGH